MNPRQTQKKHGIPQARVQLAFAMRHVRDLKELHRQTLSCQDGIVRRSGFGNIGSHGQQVVFGTTGFEKTTN